MSELVTSGCPLLMTFSWIDGIRDSTVMFTVREGVKQCVMSPKAKKKRILCVCVCLAFYRILNRLQVCTCLWFGELFFFCAFSQLLVQLKTTQTLRKQTTAHIKKKKLLSLGKATVLPFAKNNKKQNFTLFNLNAVQTYTLTTWKHRRSVQSQLFDLLLILKLRMKL